jgi:hypothetical protein
MHAPLSRNKHRREGVSVPRAASDFAQEGLLLFARYAFMPNRLGYCGGDVRGVFETCAAGETSPDVRDWALQFEGAYPYLALIARANEIADPFDPRVVEAYWVGNTLLHNASLAPLYDSLRERFAARLSPKNLNLILGQVPNGAHPFHAFHVLDVCRRTGALAASLPTLDNCRISWGQVEAVVNGSLQVSVQPLVFESGQLVLGAPQTRMVTRQMNGRGFVNEVYVGDWVSIHWDWACDVLNPRQLENLRRYTRESLTLANQAL